MRRLQRYLPTPAQLQSSRWLRWAAPALAERRLWAFRRRGVAAGLAIGVFFGLLVPVAQIVLAVIAAVLLRANVAVAAGTTLITNPFTFGPIYYLAYKTGAALLGEPALLGDAALAPDAAAGQASLMQWWERVAGVGKPLAVGLATFAVAGAALGYVAVDVAWRTALAVRRRAQRRRRVVARP